MNAKWKKAKQKLSGVIQFRKVLTEVAKQLLPTRHFDGFDGWGVC